MTIFELISIRAQQLLGLPHLTPRVYVFLLFREAIVHQAATPGSTQLTMKHQTNIAWGHSQLKR